MVELLVLGDDRLSAEAAFGDRPALSAIDFDKAADRGHHLLGRVAHEARQAIVNAFGHPSSSKSKDRRSA